MAVALRSSTVSAQAAGSCTSAASHSPGHSESSGVSAVAQEVKLTADQLTPAHAGELRGGRREGGERGHEIAE